MERPPRAAREPRDRPRAARAGVGRARRGLGACWSCSAFLFVLLRAGWHPGDATGAGAPLHDAWLQATTMTFAGIVACQVGTAFAARTERAVAARSA